MSDVSRVISIQYVSTLAPESRFRNAIFSRSSTENELVDSKLTNTGIWLNPQKASHGPSAGVSNWGFNCWQITIEY